MKRTKNQGFLLKVSINWACGMERDVLKFSFCLAGVAQSGRAADL